MINRFRREVYQSFTRRADAGLDLIDALTSERHTESPVAVSESPLFRREFSSVYDLLDLLNWAGNGLVSLGLGGIGQGLADFSIRDLNFTTRAILALVIGYSAFISEIFRAGIESIEKGQMEAARSLGMSYWQSMRHVILPQSVRRVLPPLGNDFVAMLKDSSLVSVLGVQDITQLGKLYATSTFRFFETYNVVAFLYLVMTIALSLLVRYLEKRMPQRSNS